MRILPTMISGIPLLLDLSFFQSILGFVRSLIKVKLAVLSSAQGLEWHSYIEGPERSIRNNRN